MAWDFKREENKNFDTNIPEGAHRIRVKSADKAVSKNGNDMLTLTFEVSGFNSLLFHHIVFMPDRPEITNRMLTAFFDSFKDIPEGEFDMSKWIGKVGACQVKHEEYNGNTNAKLHYFIPVDKQGSLPAWKEPTNSGATQNAPASSDGFVSADSVPTELPF